MNGHGVRYGVLAEFADPETLVVAIGAARAHGYRRMEAYTPYPVPEAARALGYRHTFIPTIVLLGGLFGCLGGFAMQYWMNAVDYAYNVGGRPLNSWPMFVPITFELTVLCAGLAALVSMCALNGLPCLHHPLFNVERFAQVGVDRFFLCIEAEDPAFDADGSAGFLLAHGAREVTHVDAYVR